jgi:hypothetical protein
VVGRLWRTDGTAEGTFALPLDGIGDVRGIGEGSVFSSTKRGAYLVVIPAKNDGACPNYPRELWFSDGSVEGTVQLGVNDCAGGVARGPLLALPLTRGP